MCVYAPFIMNGIQCFQCLRLHSFFTAVQVFWLLCVIWLWVILLLLLSLFCLFFVLLLSLVSHHSCSLVLGSSLSLCDFVRMKLTVMNIRHIIRLAYARYIWMQYSSSKWLEYYEVIPLICFTYRRTTCYFYIDVCCSQIVVHPKMILWWEFIRMFVKSEPF